MIKIRKLRFLKLTIAYDCDSFYDRNKTAITAN